MHWKCCVTAKRRGTRLAFVASRSALVAPKWIVTCVGSRKEGKKTISASDKCLRGSYVELFPRRSSPRRKSPAQHVNAAAAMSHALTVVAAL